MRTVYLVPNTHYDVAWAFTREDYFKIFEAILEGALTLMEKDELKFCLEQTYLLEEIEKRDPKLWTGLRRMIKKGRLEIVDGQYLMPDSMLPTGEVLVREILFGKRYCREKFGVDVMVAWCADSFGMNAQLPQIYRKSGYKWLAFRRGARRDIRQSEFLWKGLDGTTILAHWMPLGYRAGLYLDKWEEAFVELNKYAATPHILMPCGSGSLPPQPEIPQAIEEWNRRHSDTQVKMATPSEFFQAVEASGKRLEVVDGELYDDELVDVFPQVCSTRAWILQGIRECEGLLFTTETFATIAWLLGMEYPEGELRESWKKALYLAFHDIITGSGTDEIYTEVRELLLQLKEELRDLLYESLAYIAERISLREEGVVAFNSLSWRANYWIEAEVKLAEIRKKRVGIRDGEERETQVLWEGRGLDRGKMGLGFVAELPPLGYKVYTLFPGGSEPASKIKVDGNQVETPFFRLVMDENTGIIEVFDQEGRLQIRGNELVIEDEVGDLYHHRSRFDDLIKSESGEGLQYGSFKSKSFRVEPGELRTKLVFENEYYCLTWPYRMKEKFPPLLYKYKVLDIRKEVIVYRDLPRIEFITRVDNKYPNIRLRVRFDTGMERKVYFRETQFGVVPEPTEYYAKRTRPRPSGIPNFLSWFDLSDGVRGITFMNKGLPAVEFIEDRVYITLFRSVCGLSADGIAGPLIPTPDALELRSYTFEYAIELHEGDWRQAEIYKRAQEYHHLPFSFQISPSEGDLPEELSFLEISPYNLVLSALKKAEDGEEVILRFFETKGEETLAEVRFFQPVQQAWRTNLLEEKESEIAVEGNLIRLEVKPFEIVTLRLRF